MPSEVLGPTPRDIKRTVTVVAGRGCVRTGKCLSFERSQLKTHLGAQIHQFLVFQCVPSVRYHLGISFTHLIGLAGNQICHLDPAGEGSYVPRPVSQSFVPYCCPQKQFHLKLEAYSQIRTWRVRQTCSLFLAPQVSCVQQRSFCGRSTLRCRVLHVLQHWGWNCLLVWSSGA